MGIIPANGDQREGEGAWSGEGERWLFSITPRTTTSVFTFTGIKVLQGGEGVQAGCHKRGEIGEISPTRDRERGKHMNRCLDSGIDLATISGIEGQGIDGKGGIGLGIGSSTRIGTVQMKVVTTKIRSFQMTVGLQSIMCDHRRQSFVTV